MAFGMSPAAARCLVDLYPDMVRGWLRTLPGTAAEQRLVRAAEPGFPACFNGTAGFAGGWISEYNRVAMRAGLVRSQLQARRARLPAQAPALPAEWWDGPAADPAARQAIVAAQLGRCLATSRWADAVALVQAVDPAFEAMTFRVATRAENAHRREAAAVDAALDRLLPGIAGCVPAGVTLRLDRPRLRSLVEEAVYHLTDPAAPLVG